MRRPRFLLDCDGVLADFVARVLQVVNHKLGTGYTRGDVTEFDFARSLNLAPTVAAAVRREIGTPGFAKDLPVYPGATHGVAALREIADVYIVTWPWDSVTWVSDRNAWLELYFGICANRVIHTSAKHVCSGDALVDDRTSTLEQWQAANPRGIAVQWQTPHNRTEAWHGLSTGSWSELIEIALRIRDAKP